MALSRTYLAASAAILIATGGCNLIQGGNGGSEAPAGVTSQAIQAAVQDEQLRRFYEARQWQPAWNSESERQLLETIRGGVRHGINPAAALREIENAGSPTEREVALSKAALTYATALARGVTDPTRLAAVYTVPRNEVDVARGLADAVGQNNASQWIESQAPQDEEYRALSNAYVQLLQAQQQQQQGNQPQGNQVQANQQGAQQNGAQPREADVAEGNQQASRPKQKGEARRAAAAELPPTEQAVIIAVNMERRRWLQRTPPATRIDVNTAASFLRYYRDGQVADQRVVVNGEPGWETPELGSPLFRLVANPTWTVPPSIEQDELASLSAAQLARRNIVRENGRLVQQPGPQNALGLVKFDLQNDQAIYLHDTPAKPMFDRPERHLSHGCVRVRDALGFARLIAQDQGKLEEFERAQNRTRTEGTEINPTYINLDRQIPVRLLYQTVYLDNGRLTFAPDAYGWDAAVAEGLGLPMPRASQQARQRAQQKRAQRQRGADYGP